MPIISCPIKTHKRGYKMLEEIMKEKISADHLLYVSLKYTKTCDVILNLLRRWKIMLDESIESILEKAKKKKIIKKIPIAPRPKIEAVKEILKKDKEMLKVIEFYELLKKIEDLEKTREHEFRKGVCLRIKYKGKETAVNMDKLKEYSELLERFISYVKQFLLS